MSASYTLDEYARDLGISECPRHKDSPRESIGERIRCLLDIERDYIEGDASDDRLRCLLDIERDYLEGAGDVSELVEALEAEVARLKAALLLVPAFTRRTIQAFTGSRDLPELAHVYGASYLLGRFDEDEPEDTRDRDETDRHETSFAAFGLER